MVTSIEPALESVWITEITVLVNLISELLAIAVFMHANANNTAIALKNDFLAFITASVGLLGVWIRARTEVLNRCSLV